MNVIVVEDQSLFRQLIVKMCSEKFNVVGEAGSGQEALDICRETKPDILLLDIRIPEPDGISVAETLIEEQSSLRVLAVSAKLDSVTVFRLLKSGVHGYVNKFSDELDTVMRAMDAIARGEPYFSESFAQVKEEIRKNPLAFHKILSNKELELLPMFSKGLDDGTIGQLVTLSDKTVRWHRRNVMKKLELHATTELMRYGIAQGFWDIEEATGLEN
ncbi:response regulator transcription factor [Cerasicoccus maritimus]|uniref:response regulator transcription factor n=1 Tax=Cerasicoccus maritimus TaxID=490089 RepID=UPI002852A567|nr:response regulator transcription factor [Cerasicoccus maritimus]